MPDVVDRMIKVPDAGSYASAHFLAQLLRHKPGGSTGTNLYGVFQLMAEMHEAGISGLIVSLICDVGDRYLDTYYSDDWLVAHGHDVAPPHTLSDRQRQVIQPGICAAFCHQLLVRTLLLDPVIRQHHDSLRVADRR